MGIGPRRFGSDISVLKPDTEGQRPTLTVIGVAQKGFNSEKLGQRS